MNCTALYVLYCTVLYCHCPVTPLFSIFTLKSAGIFSVFKNIFSLSGFPYLLCSPLCILSPYFLLYLLFFLLFSYFISSFFLSLFLFYSSFPLFLFLPFYLSSIFRSSSWIWVLQPSMIARQTSWPIGTANLANQSTIGRHRQILIRWK